MNKLRDCAIVLGLAGAILMVTADTKEVEATYKISNKSEIVSCIAFATPGEQWLQETDIELARIQREQEIEEQQRIAEEQAERERREAEEQAEQERKEAEEQAEQERKEVEENVAQKEKPEAFKEENVAQEEVAAYNWVYEVSEADYTALLKIVEAETSGEDLTGRMLVANVVLNRVKSPAFPNTIEEVVYQSAGGKAQFSPVATGKIERVKISEETKEAVERALCGEDPSQGALYFVAPAYANPENLSWFRNCLRMVLVYHGHEFYV